MNIIRSSQLPYVAASHEDPNDPGSLKKVLFAARDFSPRGNIQMINWAKIAPGKQFRSHYHQDMAEVFLIVQGVAEIQMDQGSATLHPGDAVLIPAGCVHQMTNTGGSDVEYLVVGVSQGQGGKTVVV